MMEEALMLKKVVLHSVATAFASMVLPVPGGPYKRMPFQGLRIPWTQWKGKTKTKVSTHFEQLT